MKSYNKEEFIEYVKKLEFDELEDMALFVRTYYEYYRNISEDDKQDKDAAWEKYMILQSKFGSAFVEFTLAVIDYRKKLNEELKALDEKDSGTTALEG